MLFDDTTTKRFWAKVDKAGPNGCWIWTASLGSTGYGQFKANRRIWKSHRVAYVLCLGNIPNGLILDHLCRVRPCVNPWHLEVVTLNENIKRGDAGKEESAKTHCVNGHPFTDLNIYRDPRKPHHRYCRACRRNRNLESEARQTQRKAAFQV